MLAVLAACGTMVVLGSAMAQSQPADKLAACEIRDRASVDRKVKACTDLIQSGRLSDKTLARAYTQAEADLAAAKQALPAIEREIARYGIQ